MFCKAVPLMHQREISCTGSDKRVALEGLFRKFLGIFKQVLEKNLVFASRIHFLKSLKDCLCSRSANVRVSNKEIRLKIIMCGDCLIVECDVNSCKNEIFG